MSAFDIGWEPEGWKRGDKLRVVACRPVYKDIDGKHVDVRTTIGYAQWDKEISYGDTFPEIALVTCGVDDVERFNAWLKWWQQ